LLGLSVLIVGLNVGVRPTYLPKRNVLVYA
jgi:hypothetical protein